MNLAVLVFYPGETSYIGLWRPAHTPEWHTLPYERLTDQSNLLDTVSQLLDETHSQLGTLTHIGVMTGPASYTQLRLFVTTANTFAWTLGLPLFSFTRDDSMPASIPHLLSKAKRNIPSESVYPPIADPSQTEKN